MLKNNKQTSYLLILLSIFILFFITLGQYNSLQENLDNKSEAVSKLLEKEEKLNELNKLKQKIKTDIVKKDIEKYAVNFNEDEIFKYIYDYAFQTLQIDSKIVIKGISLSEGVKNELGFIESNINLQLRVENERAMTKFMNFLLKEDSKYSFFIDSFSYPYDNNKGSFDVTMPLKMFYIK